MRTLEINKFENGTIIITIEDYFLCGLPKFKRRYIAVKQYMEGFWDWRKLPKMTGVKPINALHFNFICQQQEECNVPVNIYEKGINNLIIKLYELIRMSKSQKEKDAYNYSITELRNILNNNGNT